MKSLNKILLLCVLSLLLLFSSCKMQKRVIMKISDDEEHIEYVKQGDTISSFKPEKEGMEFVGWLKDGEPYDINTPVEKNFVLTASFVLIEYEVKLIVDDDVIKVIKTNIKDTFFKETLNREKPQKEDYIFLYWLDEDGNKFDVSKYKPKNITLRAYFVLDSEYTPTLKVSFNSTGAKIDYDSIMVTRLSKIGNLPLPNWTGHNFLGWYLNDELIDEDSIIREIEDIVLIAKWD